MWCEDGFDEGVETDTRGRVCSLSLNVRPMAIASPALFICVVMCGVGLREFLEGEAWDLGDDVINGRLKARGVARAMSFFNSSSR
jgi:hypothetical protein